METKQAHVYRLIDPTNGAVRYIGCSIHPEKRLKEYSSPAFVGRSIYRWVCGLRKLGMWPTMEIIETCDVARRDEREKHWIRSYADSGHDLLNTKGMPRR